MQDEITAKTDNSSFERVEEFKYFETTLTNQNSIAEEIKIRLKSGNVCYHSAQNLLSSSLLFKHSKLRNTKPVFCLLLCLGVKLGHSH